MNFTIMEKGNTSIKSLMSKSFGLNCLSPQIVNRIIEELLFDLTNVVYQANAVKDKSGCSMLMPSHVDIALKRRNIPPQYGFRCNQNKPFGLVSGGGCDLNFIEEDEVDLKKFVNESKLFEEPKEMEIDTHWVDDNGVQTTAPENASFSEEQKGTDVSTDSDDTFRTPSYNSSSTSEDLEIQRPQKKPSGLGII